MYQSQNCQTFIEQLIAIENQKRRTDCNWFSVKYRFSSSMFLLFDNEQSVKEKPDKVTVISVPNLFLLISRSPLPFTILFNFYKLFYSILLISIRTFFLFTSPLFFISQLSTFLSFSTPSLFIFFSISLFLSYLFFSSPYFLHLPYMSLSLSLSFAFFLSYFFKRFCRYALF
jgi:hypothetical protein